MRQCPAENHFLKPFFLYLLSVSTKSVNIVNGLKLMHLFVYSGLSVKKNKNKLQVCYRSVYHEFSSHYHSRPTAPCMVLQGEVTAQDVDQKKHHIFGPHASFSCIIDLIRWSGFVVDVFFDIFHAFVQNKFPW